MSNNIEIRKKMLDCIDECLVPPLNPVLDGNGFFRNRRNGNIYPVYDVLVKLSQYEASLQLLKAYAQNMVFE